MADFNSKYTGEQVEAMLDIVAAGGGGDSEGGTITEAEITAMGFTKNLGTITEVKMNGVSKGTSGVVDLGTVITEHQDISGKQDKITDLDTIRSGAEKGATALQSVPSEYVTETELTNKGYATTTQLADKVDKVSGKQLSTEDFTTALKTKLEGLNNYDDTEIENAVSSLQTQFNTLVSGNASDAINSFNEIIAFLDGVKDSEDLSSIIASIEQQIAGKMDKVTLAAVATSGSYSDLSNKPTIPSAVTESTVSGWGFTKNTGTYSKPSSGIPKSDLASAVQTSLGKADTALQSYTEQYTGTITGIKMNGVSKGTSGVVDLGTVITAHQDISGKQDTLVSGTNIKTINGTSILGSGNIVIEGGSGSSSTVRNYPVVNVTEDYAIICPNTFYKWGVVEGQLSVYLEYSDSDYLNEYLFEFVSREDTYLEMDSRINWSNNEPPQIEPNKIYQISIVNDLAIYCAFDFLRTFFVNGLEYTMEHNMTWEQFVDSEYNTDGFYIDSGYVYIADGSPVNHDFTEISSEDCIMPDYAYTTTTGGGN